MHFGIVRNVQLCSISALGQRRRFREVKDAMSCDDEMKDEDKETGHRMRKLNTGTQ